MLTPEQITALRDRAGHIMDPINDYLLEDIARRISEAGQLTSTAAYQIWRSQKLGVSQREIKKQLKKLLNTSRKEINKLLTQSAEVGYRFDLERLPTSAAIPFEKNGSLQQIVQAAVNLALEDFTNITQTIGMVDPYGNALPLQDVYRSCTDFAFKQVITGATDYNTAIRQATKNLVDKGVRTIDYESGVHTSVEAAVRRNIMGGLGLMQEQISQHNHDTLGADGWELSAHANSAPDHEPIQGKQFTDKEYEALNNSLHRRIGTLNCGHVAFPIILGVNEPQYTQEQLEKFRTDNEKGVTIDGRHYTGYEATQMQRKIERSIRKQKKRILVDEATGDKDKLLTDQIKLQRLRQEYSRFSKAAGLRTENERLHVAGFGRKKLLETSIKADTIRSSGALGDTDGNTTLTKIESVDFSDQKAVAQKLTQFTNEFSYAETEHALVLSPNGKAYSLDGSKSTVNTDLVGTDALKGSIVIHNHPVPGSADFYDSFSNMDLVSSARTKTAEEYLVSGKRLHYLKLDPEITPEEISTLYKNAYNEVLEEAFNSGVPIEYEQLQIMRKIAETDKRVTFIELR